MNNELHLFDLDETLINTHAKWVVISKNNPADIIMSIDSSEMKLVTSYYQKWNLKTEYLGKTNWLSPKIWSDIKKKRPTIRLEEVGISPREWTQKEDIERKIKKTDFIINNIKHLKKGTEIGILTGRGSFEHNSEIIDLLTDQLSKRGLILKYIYFVNDVDNNTDSDTTAWRKAIICLEHLIGYKVDSKIHPLVKNWYQSVHFYDDNIKNIDAVKNIQTLFEEAYKESDDEVKNIIRNRIDNSELSYSTNLVTQNQLNRFKTTTNKLFIPIYYKNKIKTYESFRNI
jgi:hypothetical protein